MKIKSKTLVFFIDKDLIKFVFKLAKNQKEKIGYIFGSQIKGTNEIKVNYWTSPHPSDISTKSYSKISKKHKKIGKKILRKNKHLSTIGFFHTHPNSYSINPSNIDLKEFKKASKKIGFFIIGCLKEISIYVYEKRKIVYCHKIKKYS